MALKVGHGTSARGLLLLVGGFRWDEQGIIRCLIRCLLWSHITLILPASTARVRILGVEVESGRWLLSEPTKDPSRGAEVGETVPVDNTTSHADLRLFSCHCYRGLKRFQSEQLIGTGVGQERCGVTLWASRSVFWGFWGFGVDDDAGDTVMELRRLSLGLLPSESA